MDFEFVKVSICDMCFVLGLVEGLLVLLLYEYEGVNIVLVCWVFYM